MILKRTFPMVILILALGAMACAQDHADVTGRIIRTRADTDSIAVEDFKIERAVSAEDSALAYRLTEVIRNDLSFHVAFDHIPLDSFLMEVFELQEMTKRAWLAMGVEHLVTGMVEFRDEDIRVRYTLWDLNRMRDIKSDGFKTNRANFRALSHSIADDVVKQVTGMKPIFNSKIAFISARSGNKEVYACDYDGAGEYPVTSNGSINLSPVWDARGKSIYYTSYKGGTPQLWKVDLNKGNHSKVAAYQGLNSAAAISPNNDNICLTLSKDGNAELYLLDMNGGVRRRLTHTKAIESSPSFGPDGNTLAFSSDRTGSPQVYLMGSDGLNVHRVTYNGSYNDSPALSPDGSKIAFVTRTKRGNFDICVVDVTGENFRVITNSGSNENPHWAPDSYHLVYSTRHGDTYDIYIADFQGISRRRISTDSKSSNPYWSPYFW